MSRWGSKFRWWRIWFPDFGFFNFSVCLLRGVRSVAASVVCFVIVLWLNLSGLRCSESGLLLRHCAFWQSLCCKLLLKHQRSRVMISVNTHEKEEWIKSPFYSEVCVNSLEMCESEGLQKASRGRLLRVKIENLTKKPDRFLFDPQQMKSSLFQHIFFILFLHDQRKTHIYRHLDKYSFKIIPMSCSLLICAAAALQVSYHYHFTECTCTHAHTLPVSHKFPAANWLRTETK